jgi:hypothetical protein
MSEKSALPEVHKAYLAGKRKLPEPELDYAAEIKGAMVKGRDQRVKKATRIVKQMLRASEIGGDEYDYSKKPEGWTDEQYRI